MPDTDENARLAALEFARAMAAYWQAQLGAELLGFYLIGSLAHDGFNRRYSDIDVALVEREPARPARPTLDEVRAYLEGRPLEVWAERAARFATLDRLEAADHKTYLRAHLYPARFVFSWMTGDIASNDTAVAYLSENAPGGLDVALIGRALSCRHQAADPDGLFGERNLLPGQVAACRRMIAG